MQFKHSWSTKWHDWQFFETALHAFPFPMTATVVVVRSTMAQNEHVLGQLASIKSPNSEPGSQYPWTRHPPHLLASRVASWHAGSGTIAGVVVVVVAMLGVFVVPPTSQSQKTQPSGSFHCDGAVPAGHSSWLGHFADGHSNGEPSSLACASPVSPLPASLSHKPQLAGHTAAITPRPHNPTSWLHSADSPSGRHNAFGPSVVTVVVVLVVVITLPSQPTLHEIGQRA